jgi:hypothetical protein
MFRWTVTTRNTRHRGQERTVEQARRTATILAEKSQGGGIVTIDDLDGKRTTFETFTVIEKSS